jgi:hypothetical protein
MKKSEIKIFIYHLVQYVSDCRQKEFMNEGSLLSFQFWTSTLVINGLSIFWVVIFRGFGKLTDIINI